MDTERLSSCTDCRRCEKVCFMDVKPRAPRRDINCVNCGECIEACNMELGHKKGLFKFSMPKPGRIKSSNNNETVDLALDYKQPLKGG
jgi:ferredoxin